MVKKKGGPLKTPKDFIRIFFGKLYCTLYFVHCTLFDLCPVILRLRSSFDVRSFQQSKFNILCYQARSKAITTGGAEQFYLNKTTPTPSPVTQKRLIREPVKMQPECQAVDLVSKTIIFHLHHAFWYISLLFFFMQSTR